MLDYPKMKWADQVAWQQVPAFLFYEPHSRYETDNSNVVSAQLPKHAIEYKFIF